MSVSTSIATTVPAIASPWLHTPDWYKEQLCSLLGSHINRVKMATGLTLDQIATERLGWVRGNHLSQLKSENRKHILSPATALAVADALELDEAETDELVILTMRANSNRGCAMTPEFLHRYEMAAFRKVIEVAKARGIRLS